MNIPIWRAIVPLILLVAETLFLSLSFDSYSPALYDSSLWYSFIAYTGQIAKIMVVFLAAILLALWKRLDTHIQIWEKLASKYRFIIPLLIHLVVYVTLFLVTKIIFGSPDEVSNQNYQLSPILILFWLLLCFLFVATWLLSLAPGQFWFEFVRIEIKYILTAFVIAVCAWGGAIIAQGLWEGGLLKLTFLLSAFLLNFIYSEIYIDFENKDLGTSDFIVNIAPVCSGLEGIALVVIFTGFYLYIFRKDFRFPYAMLLFPLGVVTIWVFNIFRIVILIILGSNFSEDVALGGFHSQAGWIFFIMVTFGLLQIAHSFPFFSSRDNLDEMSDQRKESIIKDDLSEYDQQSNAYDSQIAQALLIPFIIFISATMLVMAFSGNFEWMYPLKVLATGIALILYWNRYQLKLHFNSISFWSIVAGVLVFMLWMVFVPENQEIDQQYQQSLTNAPRLLSFTWIIFRMIGGVLIVPLVEELMFRGYLLARVTGERVQLHSKLRFSWIGLVISSLLFGFLHADFIAGMVAGIVYGVLRYKSESVLNPIVAHMVTNLMLAIYVLSSGAWSYW